MPAIPDSAKYWSSGEYLHLKFFALRLLGFCRTEVFYSMHICSLRYRDVLIKLRPTQIRFPACKACCSHEWIWVRRGRNSEHAKQEHSRLISTLGISNLEFGILHRASDPIFDKGDKNASGFTRLYSSEAFLSCLGIHLGFWGIWAKIPD